MENIKFVMSYSGGKDGTLALYRAIKLGYKPISLFTTYDIDKGRSFFHGIPENILKSISESLNIPINIIKTKGEKYGDNLEKNIIEYKEKGVNTAVFGDIDIIGHYEYCDNICKNAGVNSLFPLWNESRKDLVYEFIDSGFKAMITIVDNTRMDEKYLGKTLTRELVDEIERDGVDICGENGEYHSFVYDGPIFKNPIAFEKKEILRIGNYSVIPIE